MRLWCRWWSDYLDSDGCTEPPFTFWESGEREDPPRYSFVAMVDAPSIVRAKQAIYHHFPDCWISFIQPREDGHLPSDRFPPPEGGIKTTIRADAAEVIP